MRVLRTGSRLLESVSLSRSSFLASQCTYNNIVPHWIVAGPRMSVGAAGSFQQACAHTVPLATSGQSGAFSPEIVSMRMGSKSPGLQAARSRSGLLRRMQGHNTIALITGRTRDLVSAPWAPSTQGSRVLSIIPEDGVAGIKQRFKLILKEYGKVRCTSSVLGVQVWLPCALSVR